MKYCDHRITQQVRAMEIHTAQTAEILSGGTPSRRADVPQHLHPRRRLATVRQTTQAYAGLFTEQGIRDLIFKAEDRFNFRGDRIKGNGLADHGAIVRLGRRVLIDLDGFESWLDSHKAR